MSFVAAMTALLTPLAPGGLYWDESPDDGPKSSDGFMVLQEVGGKAGWYVEKKIPDHQHARLQVFVAHTRKLEAEALINRVQSVICESQFPAEPIGAPVAVRHPTLKIYGYRQQFGVWYPTP